MNRNSCTIIANPSPRTERMRARLHRKSVKTGRNALTQNIQPFLTNYIMRVRNQGIPFGSTPPEPSTLRVTVDSETIPPIDEDAEDDAPVSAAPAAAALPPTIPPKPSYTYKKQTNRMTRRNLRAFYLHPSLKPQAIRPPILRFNRVNAIRIDAANKSGKEDIAFDIDPELPEDDRHKIQVLLSSLMHAFASSEKKEVAPAPGVEHSIHLTDEQPIKQRAYNLSPEKQAVVKSTVEKLLELGLIRESNSPWASSPVLVLKSDGSWRMCIDYRKVNAVTKKDAYPIPLIQDCLNFCKDATWLALIDIKDAYHHVLMAEKSIQCTAFATQNGLYEWLRMPFGLCNAPATFQRYVDNCLRDLIGKTCAAFFDDCLVYTTGTLEEHMADVQAVLTRLSAAGLEANLKKCKFGYSEIKFIGHIVGKGMIRPDPEKVTAVSNYAVPQNLSQLRSFLGLVNYYHDFVKGFALIARPLYQLTRKDVPWEWSGLANAAFESLKACLLTKPCLYPPDFAKPFILQTDASGVGIGAVLTQVIDGKEHPIGFISRQLSKHEMNYSAIEWECLAVVWAVGVFEVYLSGAPFTVVTDHAPLQWLPTKRLANSRLQRWALILSEFSFTVVHRAGTANGNADSISRAPVPGSAPDDDTTDPVGFTPGSMTPHYVRRLIARSHECPFPTVSEFEGGKSDMSTRTEAALQLLYINVKEKDMTREEASIKAASIVANSSKGVRASDPTAVSLLAMSTSASSSSAPNNDSTEQDISIIDLSQLKKVIDAQYADGPIKMIIDYKLHKSIPTSLNEAMQRRLIAQGYNYVLMTQPDGIRPGLFYLPARPRRGLSSLVPVVPKLVIPPNYRKFIIEMFHNYAFGGHLGERKTLRRIQANYHWETLGMDIIKFIHECNACQTMKIQRKKLRRPPGLMEHPTRPFELMSMDFVVFDKRSNGFRNILVLVDHFSRFAITIPTVDQRAETIARCLINEVYCRYGTPTRLSSDRGSDFRSELIRELHRTVQVKQLFTSGYHPKANGMVERFNATLKDMLLSLGAEFGEHWEESLQSATFAYNTSPHEATGISPYYCLYGREATVPGDALAIMAAAADVDSDVPHEVYNQYLLDNIGRAHEFVKSLLETKKIDNLETRRKYARIPVYQVGDKVYVRDLTVQAQARFIGPWEVLRRVSEFAYEVQRCNRSKYVSTVNVDRLKPYHETEEDLEPNSEPFIAPVADRVLPRIPSLRHRSGIGKAEMDDDDEELKSDQEEEEEEKESSHMSSAAAAPANASVDSDHDEAMNDQEQVEISPAANLPYQVSDDPPRPSTHKPRHRAPAASASAGSGPASSALARHAGRSRPILSDSHYDRLPGNPSHARYSQPQRVRFQD